MVAVTTQVKAPVVDKTPEVIVQPEVEVEKVTDPAVVPPEEVSVKGLPKVPAVEVILNVA
jgi:hypothetical protein